MATHEQWRALVEKDLAGKPFDKTLNHEALDGLSVAPLYHEAPALDPAARHVRTKPFAICIQHDATGRPSDLATEVANGADALWVPFTSQRELLAQGDFAQTTFVLEPSEVPRPEVVKSLPERAIVAIDPIAWRARGQVSFANLADDLAALGNLAVTVRGRPLVVVSTEPYHDAGADAVEEIALALSTGAAYLDALLGAGLDIDEAAVAITLRTTVGRDTFVELCKLRALRICWQKVLAAGGSTRSHAALLHAVCSAQTLTVRDPWVNMLRVTTQMFAAITGGADLVTPRAYDDAFRESSALGQRVARNTGLVLREESALGQVSDPAGGSYYFDSLTDALARKAWTRFRDLQRDGGVAKLLESGALPKSLEAAWKRRLERIAKRKTPILGVSEFANLGEKLPHAVPAASEASAGGLPLHHEATAFEALRIRAEALPVPPEVRLVTLGIFAESRPRAGFAATFFAAGGLATREQTSDEAATVMCLCGTDAAYGEHAANRIRALKAAGAKMVLVAGRPSEIAGADGFIFMGCDVVAALSDVLATFTTGASHFAKEPS